MNLKTRFLSSTLDWFIIYILFDLIFRENYGIYLALDQGTVISYSNLGIKLFAIFLYYLVFSHFFSATLSQMLLGIKVVGFDKKKPTFKQILLRINFYFLSIIIFPSFFYLVKKGQAWHDVVSKTTLVIKNN